MEKSEIYASHRFVSLFHFILSLHCTKVKTMKAFVVRVALFLGALIGEIVSIDPTASLTSKHDSIPNEGVGEPEAKKEATALHRPWNVSPGNSKGQERQPALSPFFEALKLEDVGICD